MLQLYNLDKVKIRGLKLYKDYCIESELSSGDKTLSFLYPERLCKEIIEESYIRNKKDEFVVKSVSGSGEWKTIVATLNVEDLEGKVFESFDTTNKTITESLNLALAGTGWSVGTCDVTRRRTVRKTYSSSWEIIQEAKKRYRVELEFDTLKKKINIFDKRGSDKGVYFSDSLNLRDIDIQGNSYEFYTRIIAIGKDDIRVTLENVQYSKKVKTFIWKDERYTDIDSLREDAKAKLDEISKPYRAYSANVIDLASIKEEYEILNYGLGDTINLVSKDKGIKEKQRIAKMIEYPDEPERNTCEIANITLKFEDIQKEFQDAADTVNNITTDNGTIDGSTIDGIKSEQIYDFEANVVKITDLTVVNARIENLYAEKANIGQLNAVEANIAQLNATKANITDLNAINATITNLEATTAKITDLTAINAKINVLEVDTASIKTLLAGNITGKNIQAGGITSNKLTIANGFITNAMIANLDVSKINAGDISTNKFKIKSDDGAIEIIGATQQFKDKNNKVRIQMGKDTQGNFNFILRGEDGTSTLIDHTGIKKGAIANDLIIKDMIASDAVGEKQIDYNSFATGFNKDTNTTTLKATKIKLDNQNQTLDVAFSSLKTEVQEIEIGGRNLIIRSGEKTDTMVGANGEFSHYVGSSLMENYIEVKPSKSLMFSQVKSIGNDDHYFRYAFYKADKITMIVRKANDSNNFLEIVPANAEYLRVAYASKNKVKLENGNKATDFTIAPEDTDKSIADVKEITTSNSTTIGVMQGQISTAINNTQIIKDGKTILLKDDYNRTVQTVNSSVETIGRHESTINQNTGAITNVNTEVTEVKKSLTGITQRVGTTETNITTVTNTANKGVADALAASNKAGQVLIDAKNYTNAEITTVTTKVTNANTEIQQLKNKIALKVEATDVITTVNKAIEDTMAITETKINQVKADITIETNKISSKVETLESTEIANRKVGSFRYVRDYLNGSNVNSGNNWIELQVIVDGTNIAKGKMATCSTTLVNGQYITDGHIDNNHANTSAGWHWIQIDLGSERTDIDLVKTWHYFADNRMYNHKLMVSVDGITWFELYNSDKSGRYKETQNGRTYVINASYTESRLNYAEQKITDSAIISTVTNSSTYRNDFNGKVSSNTIISSINQTAESIKISASKLELSGYATFSSLSSSGQTIINADNIKTGTITTVNLRGVDIRGKTMIYIQENGILSCDGQTYIRDFFVPETHPGWAPGSRGSFKVTPTGYFDKDLWVSNEVYSKGKGVILREVGVAIQIANMGIQASETGHYLLLNGYQSNHAFGVDLWYSDAKLKTNIQELQENDFTKSILTTNNKVGLDLINSIKHYSFNYKNNLNDTIECGYIAQDLQEHNKQLVEEIRQQDGSIILQPKPSSIIPNLSLAIQQQQLYIDDLKNNIINQQLKIEELTKRVEQLQLA